MLKMKECEYCGNKFSRSDNLKRHQNTCQVQNKLNAILERGVKHQCDKILSKKVICSVKTILC